MTRQMYRELFAPHASSGVFLRGRREICIASSGLDSVLAVGHSWLRFLGELLHARFYCNPSVNIWYM
jgi:hypothetical protein